MRWSMFTICLMGGILGTSLSAHPLRDALVGILPPPIPAAPLSKKTVKVTTKACARRLSGMARQVQRKQFVAIPTPAEKTLIQSTLGFDLSMEDLRNMLRLPESAQYTLSKPESGVLILKALVGDKTSAEMELKRKGDKLDIALDVHGELAESFRVTPPVPSFTLPNMDEKPIAISVSCTLGNIPKTFRVHNIDLAQTNAVASEVLQRKITTEDLQKLFPSLIDLDVRVSVSRTNSAATLAVTFEHPAFRGGFYPGSVAVFLIGVENEIATAESVQFEFAPWVGEVERAVLFHDMMQAFKKLAVAAVSIKTLGAAVTYDPNSHGRGVGKWDLYFAELGGNVRFSDTYRGYIEGNFKGANGVEIADLGTLISLPGGKEWWQQNGDAIPLQFWLSPVFPSFKTLQKHMESVGVTSEAIIEDVRRTLSRGIPGDLPEGTPPARAIIPVENQTQDTEPRTQASPAS